MRRVDNLPPSCAVVTKSGNLNFLEPSGPVQACNGTALLYCCYRLCEHAKHKYCVWQNEEFLTVTAGGTCSYRLAMKRLILNLTLHSKDLLCNVTGFQVATFSRKLLPVVGGVRVDDLRCKPVIIRLSPCGLTLLLETQLGKCCCITKLNCACQL